MHRGAELTDRDDRDKKDGPALPPVATGIAMGLWITVMVTLALVVVPALFGTCSAPPS